MANETTPPRGSAAAAAANKRSRRSTSSGSNASSEASSGAAAGVGNNMLQFYLDRVHQTGFRVGPWTVLGVVIAFVAFVILFHAMNNSHDRKVHQQ